MFNNHIFENTKVQRKRFVRDTFIRPIPNKSMNQEKALKNVIMEHYPIILYPQKVDRRSELLIYPETNFLTCTYPKRYDDN